MKLLDTKDRLLAWEDYREYLKAQLKLLDGEAPFYVSKVKLDFQINGKPWKGHAVLTGPKAILSIQKLKKQGVLFREGTCTQDGKDLVVAGIVPQLVKESVKTFMKLRLGYKVAGGEGETEEGEPGADPGAEAAWKRIKAELSPQIKSAVGAGGGSGKEIVAKVREATEKEKAGDFAGALAAFEELRSQLSAAGGELSQQAAKIGKAVDVWKKTEEAATKELRKLQKALMGLGAERTGSVIKGLENIMTRMDKVDDEARAVAQAAGSGDAAAFATAREDLVKKLNAIRDYVQKDELIRMADENPVLAVNIRETFDNSLSQLLKAI